MIRIAATAQACTVALVFACLSGWISPEVQAANRIPNSAFAREPAISDVFISPDARHIAWIGGIKGEPHLLVMERHAQTPMKILLGPAKQEAFRLTWCNWANNTRLVCGYRAMQQLAGVIYPITRLVAINVDGTGSKILVQNGRAGVSQFQDTIVDWTPDDPETVLIQLDDDGNTFPTVFKLDIYNGRLSVAVREREPIRSFQTDRRGRVRLGWGYRDMKVSYFAKLEGEDHWERLARFDAFGEADVFTPVAIIPQRNTAFAIGNSNGREALWEMDLTDRRNPRLVFDHPQVDAGNVMLAQDGRMLGIRYDTDRPFAFYTDDKARLAVESARPLLPAGNFNVIADTSADEQTYVIRSSSDIDSGTYSVLDLHKQTLESIGTGYPELMSRKDDLSRMQIVRYPAADGVEIPGYLTVPVGQRAEKLPLIVMPHGGPVGRDGWYFDWLVQFLANRGYAVLQMNFRGSAGYGYQWQYAAHQDWGGLTYSDITDATRWAIAKGIADPKRICIVGWSFGGYAALLGAVRNGDLYACAASIAGVSDLIGLQDDTRAFTHSAVARAQIGVDREKLRADSPRRHAESINIPILMIHGTMDYQVRFDHSDEMADALKRANKPFKLTKIKDADHQMSRESDRETVLTELEAFLTAHLH
ncbi:MAG TPA: S9 family peptidase [Steroidobacteraceae bacterium]|nr:S9 family peptidase [Steroidobacteraceae bacterium]